jgi:hypothetical protein
MVMDDEEKIELVRANECRGLSKGKAIAVITVVAFRRGRRGRRGRRCHCGMGW